MLDVSIIFANYGPYHIARLNAFQKLIKKIGWNAVGVELARSQNIYSWTTSLSNLDYELFTVIQDKALEEVATVKVTQKTIAIISKIKPDIVAIAGYTEIPMLTTLFWAKVNRKKVVLFSASKEDDAPRAWWSEKIKSWIVRKYDAALVGGKPQKRYLEKLGMKPESIFTGYNVVGNETFHPDKINALASPHKKPYFLTINRFVPKKNLSRLISAYAEYRKQTKAEPWDLILCGDGELQSQIEKQIKELDLKEHVILPGFLQQEELLPYFAHASCFVHASTQEQWGLVVNEAMAARLPVLVSNRCGCFEDLIIEGVNGFGFDPDNIQQLIYLMLKVSSDVIDLDKIAQAALEHIQHFSPNLFAKGLKSAIKYALK